MNLKGTPSVNLDNIKHPRNRIYRIGIELEGGWDKLPAGIAKLDHDGSVVGLPISKVGEIPSPPLEVEEFEKWVRANYPNHVNETCGMHVHLSFKSALTYQRLMNPSYPATIVAYVGKWGKKALPDNHCLWERLDGRSEFCKLQYYAEQQVVQAEKDRDRQRVGNRYTIINYCWARTTTLECRLLPMMPNADTAIEAIRELLNITNSYLVATAKKEARLKGDVIMSKSHTREERNVRVRY